MARFSQSAQLYDYKPQELRDLIRVLKITLKRVEAEKRNEGQSFDVRSVDTLSVSDRESSRVSHQVPRKMDSVYFERFLRAVVIDASLDPVSFRAWLTQ